MLDRLIRSLEQAARHHSDDSAAPAAVLWTDADGQWKALVDLLQPRMPHLLVYGSYDKAMKTGPAIWLKCAIARKLEDFPLSKDVVPIIYLPGVSRQELRAGEDCPEELQPLIELQFRGAVWMQRNGKDWTVEAFLGSDDGLGLEIAKDTATRHALQRALQALAGVPIAQLAGRRLESEDFDRTIHQAHEDRAVDRGVDERRGEERHHEFRRALLIGPNAQDADCAALSYREEDALVPRVDGH